MTIGPRQADAGLSLVEMLVALVLFALVGLGSFAMLDAIIKARDRTEGRLAGFAQLDRALTIFDRDLAQSLNGISLDDGNLAFSVYESGMVIQMSYRLQDGALIRSLTTETAADPLDQTLISGVAAAEWRILDVTRNWADNWPPPDQRDTSDGGPCAVEMQLTLGGSAALSGTLRRIVALPREVAR